EIHQSRDEQGEEDDGKITTEAEEMDTDQLNIPNAKESVGPGEPAFRVSPRAITIQAEVHAVSPKQEAKAVGKVASIFNKRKGAMSPAEVVSSPPKEAGHQLPSTSVTVKWKSNVVLEEEDLELAVLESESTPKCSEAERKQFMAAFKRPSLDGSKTKPGKSQGKQKQPGELALNDADKVAEEDAGMPTSIEQVPAASQENKEVKKKPARKGRKKGKEENEAVAAPPSAAPVEETVAATFEVDDKKENPPVTSTPTIPTVRRSRREAVFRQAPEATPASPVRKNRKRNATKDADAAALPTDSPVKMSPLKIRKSKHGVFVAQMVCPPDTKQSPISYGWKMLKFSQLFQTSNESKKRKQAKKLVEKARVIQQSKKAAAEEKGTLRRSSRGKASIKKSYCEDEEALCSELLTNSQRLGVDLLYSNMEKLLPLPSTQLTTSTCKLKLSVSVSQDQPSVNPKDVQSTSLHEDLSDDGSPVKMSNRMRKTKRRHQLPDQDGLHSDSDSEDGFLSLCKPQRAPQMKDEVKESLVTKTVKRKPLTPEERQKSLPVSQCLESIADFLDNMSFMDSSLLVHPEAGNNRRRTSPGALVKDGMTDESRVEIDRGCLVRDESALEIPAAVEALSFYKCRLSTVTAWNKAQQLEGVLGQEAAAELSLPVAAHRNGYSFSQDSPCQPQLVQRRREVMENLMLKGVFGSLGNRPAASLDYLPALRTICRSEQLKEQGKVKRRFLHYLDAIHLGLDKSTLQHLAEDFL
uniref:ATPase family AAA domain containing 5a n=1 Tax=Sparus aurata TaxID=8175 RepID=A0A671X6Z8_SPAAU